jgi:hypothetical protein
VLASAIPADRSHRHPKVTAGAVHAGRAAACARKKVGVIGIAVVPTAWVVSVHRISARVRIPVQVRRIVRPPASLIRVCSGKPAVGTRVETLIGIIEAGIRIPYIGPELGPVVGG